MSLQWTQLPAGNIRKTGTATARQSRTAVVTLPNNQTVSQAGSMRVNYHTGTGTATTGNENRQLNKGIFIGALDASTDSTVNINDWIDFSTSGRGAASFAIQGRATLGTATEVELRLYDWNNGAVNLSNSDITSIWYSEATITAAELRTLLASLSTDTDPTDSHSFVFFDGDGIYQSEISNLPSSSGGTVDFSTIPANTITTAMIQNSAVTNAKIGNGAVGNTKLGTNAVTAVKIANGTITGNKLQGNTLTSTQIGPNAITSSELADNAVIRSKLADNSVGTPELLNNSISSAKIADGAIISSKIQSNAVVGSKINANSIDAGKIADGAVTLAKLDDGDATANQIIKRNADNTAWDYSDDATGEGGGGTPGTITSSPVKVFPTTGEFQTLTISRSNEFIDSGFDIPATGEKEYRFVFKEPGDQGRDLPAIRVFASTIRALRNQSTGGFPGDNNSGGVSDHINLDLLALSDTVSYITISKDSNNNLLISSNISGTYNYRIEEIRYTGTGGGTGIFEIKWKIQSLTGTNAETISDFGTAYFVNIANDNNKPLTIADPTEEGQVIRVVRRSNGDDTGNVVISVAAGSSTRIILPDDSVNTSYTLGNSTSESRQAVDLISVSNGTSGYNYETVQLGNHIDIPTDADIVDIVDREIPEAERLTNSSMQTYIDNQTTIDRLENGDTLLILDHSETAVRKTSYAQLRTGIRPADSTIQSLAQGELTKNNMFNGVNEILIDTATDKKVVDTTARTIGFNTPVTQGPPGPWDVRVYIKTAHGATKPAKPTATSFNGTTETFTGLTAGWTTDEASLKSSNYDPTTHDIWVTIFRYDPRTPNAAIVFSDVYKEDQEAGRQGPPGQSIQGPPGSDADVNATNIKAALAAEKLPSNLVSVENMDGNANGATTVQEVAESYDDKDIAASTDIRTDDEIDARIDNKVNGVFLRINDFTSQLNSKLTKNVLYPIVNMIINVGSGLRKNENTPNNDELELVNTNQGSSNQPIRTGRSLVRLRQVCTWYKRTGVGSGRRETFAAPVPLNCNWQNAESKSTNNDGVEVTGSTKVYLEQTNIQEGDRLVFGIETATEPDLQTTQQVIATDYDEQNNKFTFKATLK